VSPSPLSPADLSTALAVYVEAGSYAAAARAVGRDESTVRKALRRHSAPERAELFAMELEAAQVNALRATRRARRKAVAALDATDDPRDVALLAHVIHEGLRAVTTARSAHARLVAAATPATTPTGRVVEFSTLSDEELRAEADRLAAELGYVRPAPSTLSADELHARIARIAQKADAPVVALPRLDGAPASSDGLTVYIPREVPP
jgi:hypothetical protein